jgi:hypothetical protein
MQLSQNQPACAVKLQQVACFFTASGLHLGGAIGKILEFQAFVGYITLADFYLLGSSTCFAMKDWKVQGYIVGNPIVPLFCGLYIWFNFSYLGR